MIPAKNLLNSSQKKAVKVFKKFAKTSPFYRKYLKKIKISPSHIKTFDDFRNKVPTLDKKSLFTANLRNIKEIFPGHSLNNCHSILPSSGFSGKLSFGINTISDSKSQEKHVDLMLDYIFDVGRKKTLLINALSMGINVPTKKVVTVNTGPREDIVLSLVRIFTKEFEQTIIVGDNCLVKNIIEKGIEDGMKWPDHGIRLVLGGDNFPENFRSYLAHLLKINLEGEQKMIIASSFGIAEIGLNILWETTNTIGIRRVASRDAGIRMSLLGQNEELCPMLFQYNPLRVNVEEVSGQLVFTNLNMNSTVPIIRYASGDLGTIIPYERIVKTLKASGLQKYTPHLPFPIAALRERLQYLDFDGRLVFPGMIKNALYSDFALPNLITGYFTISKSGKKLLLEIHLKEGAVLTNAIKKKFEAAIASHLKDIVFELIFYQYREFRYGMGLDYERKFQHMRHHHQSLCLDGNKLQGYTYINK